MLTNWNLSEGDIITRIGDPSKVLLTVAKIDVYQHVHLKRDDGTGFWLSKSAVLDSDYQLISGRGFNSGQPSAADELRLKTYYELVKALTPTVPSVEMSYTVFESKLLSGCKALPLAFRSHSELVDAGLASNVVTIAFDQSALWVENGVGEPIGVLLYKYHEYNGEIWIFISYVTPGFRKAGIYKALYARLLEKAREMKARTISSGTHPDNAPMIAAAKACGRKLVALLFEAEIDLEQEVPK